MSIASELTRIETAKSNLKTSIEGKGVTVPSTATLDAYPTYVDSIEQGGGSSWAEIDDITQTTYYGIGRYVRSVELPNTIRNIVNDAFKNHTSLTSIDIPSGVRTIGGSAFYGCSGITSITIPSGVTSIEDNVFFGCRSLSSVTMPSGIKKIGSSSFYNCYNLTSIDIPSGAWNIGENAFNSCQSLQSVTIPNSVSNINNQVFAWCSSLTAVTIPNSVTNIGNGAFRGCSSLSAVTIPNSVTNIGENAFQSCSNLRSINIPSGVTSIKNYTLQSCSNLQSIDIPTSVKSIGNYAFGNCSSLTSVAIHSGVTSIGTYAFYGCTSLQSVTVLATTPPTLLDSAFNNTNDCPIFVQSESVDTYKAASIWRNYASRIQAIPQPATWELVESSFSNPSYIKVDYSLVDGSDNFGMYDVSESSGGVDVITHSIIFITQDFADYAMEEQGLDLSEYVDSAGYFSDVSDPSSFMFALEDGVEYPIADFGSNITAITPSTSTPWVYAK